MLFKIVGVFSIDTGMYPNNSILIIVGQYSFSTCVIVNIQYGALPTGILKPVTKMKCVANLVTTGTLLESFNAQ